jgi:PAS domain S-box-containing protein
MLTGAEDRGRIAHGECMANEPKRSPKEIVEELVRLMTDPDPARDRVSLLHEIAVYQEHLIVQNDELIRTHSSLEETRDRFIELYDFAPNGYLTLDMNGVIRQMNLTGASLIGWPRGQIEGVPLLDFVAPDDRIAYLEFLLRCRAAAGEPDITIELVVRTAADVTDIQLICRPKRTPPGGPGELLMAMIDIGERREREAERAETAREHAALASQLIRAQDEERHRIARDLHDNIGQQVTALRLLLQVVSMSAVDDVVRPRIEKAQSVIDEMDRHLDFMTRELRASSLDLGLPSAVERFVAEWSTTFGIAADVQCRGLANLRLDSEIATHIYRIVQEGLNNVFKHAQARRASVVLERRGTELVLIIEDDGRGFDLAAVSRHQGRGLGLVGMRERAQLVGATLDIESTPSKGTTLFLRVPISADRTESRSPSVPSRGAEQAS